MSKKVLFTFDPASLQTLQEVTRRGGFRSMGAAVREAVERDNTIGEQIEEGFSELIVRNPKTQKQKEIVVPSFRRIASRNK